MSRVKVSRYKRRHPVGKAGTPSEQKRVVEGAARKLVKLDADQHFQDICYVEVSDTDSQVVPGKGGFRRGHCSVVNMERADTVDEVEAATTLFHEGIHAHDIAQDGEDGVSKEAEIEAHRQTIAFLQDWKVREPAKEKRIDEELEEERESIEYLEVH